jgi:Uma2 family endonuclease
MTLFGKKAVYERPGVKEYIIVDPTIKPLNPLLITNLKNLPNFKSRIIRKTAASF